MYIYTYYELSIVNALLLQALSGTVAHAVLYKMRHAPLSKQPSMECKAKFLEMMGEMFDCLNVGNYKTVSNSHIVDQMIFV